MAPSGAETQSDRSEQSMSADTLSKAICEAFADSRKPDPAEIVRNLHLEGEEIRDAFRDQTWTELTVPFLTYHRQAVFFFTPEAWAYFVPAYMQAVVNRYEETDTMVNELLATIRPSNDVQSEVQRRARLKALSAAQRAVLVKFVDWVADEHPDEFEDGEKQAMIASALATDSSNISS